MQGPEDALVPRPLVVESTVVAEPLGRELLGGKLHDGFREGLKQKGRGDGLVESLYAMLLRGGGSARICA